MKTLAIIRQHYSALQSHEKIKMTRKLKFLHNKAVLLLGTTCLFFQGTNIVRAQAVENSSPPNSLLEQINRYGSENQSNSLQQISNVSQLKDVSPTDWAYEALRGLVDRYGCISGFPNQTYRGSQALSRYEFAAGLNSCLNQIERLIASSESVVREDLELIQRLSQEFEAELATIGTRIDNIEARTAALEDNQFSTTTKLGGEAVFNLAHVFIGEDASGVDIDSEPVLGYRSRLAFNTSFTGEDLLLTVLNADNFPDFSQRVTGTDEGNLGLVPIENGNSPSVLVALYMFPLGDSTTVVIEGFGGVAYDFVDTISAFDRFDDAASGALSQFGLRNPIYNQLFGSGIGIRTQLADFLEFSAGYLAPTGETPQPGFGIFDGAYGALGQLTIKPGDNFKLGLTYVNAYNSNSTFTGSNLSNPAAFPISTNSYGASVSWSLGDRLILGGWGGYINNRLHRRGDQEIWTWAGTLAFPDLLKEGSLGGIIVGMEPRVTDSTIDVPNNTDSDTSFHIEAFYQYQLTDNIAITPGAIWTTAPDHDKNNADTVIGTLRTTFTF